MKADDSAIDQFLKMWAAELGKAIEMFSGEKPAIRYERASSEAVATSDGAVWVKQIYNETEGFELWVGAPEAVWRSLGGALGEDTPESLQSTYFAIINQAQQGSVNEIDAAFSQTISLAKFESYSAPQFEAADFALFSIELVGAEMPALTLAIERQASTILGGIYATGSDGVSGASSEADARSLASSLLTLELPVSVSIGESEVEMKRVLTAGPGTIIGLDQESSESVALLVHGRVVARGEMVLVKGNYGFRVKEILNRRDRLAMCKG